MDNGSSSKRGKKKLGMKGDSCGAGEEERTVIKNLHSDLKKDILLFLSQTITQEPSPVKPYIRQRKPPKH